MYAYNPRKKTYPQLKESLVGEDRWDTLNQIQKELKLKKGEAPKQHWMIVGPRGMGKSHLLTLLYHKVSEKLKKHWIPVLFPEELRMANSLAKFLERAAKETQLELIQENEPHAKELDEKIKKARGLPITERADYLFSVFTWLHEATGRHVLFITENLQQLMGKKIDEMGLKKLRAYLQTSEAILFICSATTVFEELHDHKHPFYHFFHIKRLEDLSFESMKILIIRILSESSQPEKSKEVVKHEARLRAIYSFAGGNPRLAVFLSKILQTEVPEEIIDMMDDILDDLTPYFDAILNDMPDYQEEILNTLAEFEPAQSPKEIAEHLEIPQATVRNYIKHLKENGYVRIAFSKGKSNFYCLSEYLYRVWYQMRDSSHREETRWLMELLMMLYSPERIIEEKKKLETCIDERDFVSSYKVLIDKTTDFIRENQQYCQTIESFVVSLSEKEKELFKEAKVFTSKGKYNEAIRTYKKIVKLNPKSMSAYGLWGFCLKAINKHKDAIKKYKEVLKIEPNSELAYMSWGTCLTELGLYDEAVEKYKKAADISPDYAYVHKLWGECLREQMKYDEAIEKYQDAAKYDPNDDSIFELWGDSLRSINKRDEAISKYKEALKLNPSSTDALWGWGACLRDKGLYNEAIDKFTKTIEVESEFVAAHGAMGDCLRQLKRSEEAAECYKKAIEIEENYLDSYFAWGQLLNEQGQYDEAIKLYQKVLKIEPHSIDALGSWGTCLVAQNKYDQALKKFRHILDIEPNSLEAYKFIAKILLKSEQFDESIQIYETHFTNSNDCLVLCDYGKCLLALNRYKEAAKQFEKVINLWHSCHKVYLDYAKALEGAGKKEKALIAFVNAVKYNSTLSPFIDLEFKTILEEHVVPILKELKLEKLLKNFNGKNKKIKYQAAAILLLMGKYDLVAEHLEEILIQENVQKDSQEYELLIFTIKLCLWSKLLEGNVTDTSKLTDFYIKYIASIEEESKEKEISNLILGLFKLQVNKNISSQYIAEILVKLEKAEGVPYSEIFEKIWICISKPDTIEANKYLNEKGIAEAVKELTREGESHIVSKKL